MITPYSVICDFKSESPVLGTGEGQGDSFVYMSNMQVIVQLTGVVTWVCIRKQFQEFCPHCPPSTAANMSLASLGHTRKTSFHLHSKPVQSSVQQAERLMDQDQHVLLTVEAFLLAHSCQLFEMSCLGLTEGKTEGREGKIRGGTCIIM